MLQPCTNYRLVALARTGALSLGLALIVGCGNSGPVAPDPGDVMSSAGTGARALAQPEAIEAPGSKAVGGSDSDQHSFYPLELGARWRYTRHYRSWFTPTDGSDIQVLSDFTSTIERTLVCAEQVSGRSYTVEQVVEEWESGSRITWNRFRQDQSGLYRWQVSPNSPASCAAPLPARIVQGDCGPLSIPHAAAMTLERLYPDRVRSAALHDAVMRFNSWVGASLELGGREGEGHVTRGAGGQGPPGGGLDQEAPILRYPLHPSESWVVTPGLTRVVEAAEVVSLPAGRFTAWRIREEYGEGSANGPVHVWYGRAGFLQLLGHSEWLLADTEGKPIGTMESNFSEILDGFSPAGEGAVPATRPRASPPFPSSSRRRPVTPCNSSNATEAD